MATVILLWLPSFPFTAKFLTPRERAIAQARLKDHKPKSHGGASGWEGLKLVVTDLSAWMFVVLYVSCKSTVRFKSSEYCADITSIVVSTFLIVPSEVPNLEITSEEHLCCDHQLLLTNGSNLGLSVLDPYN